MARILKEHNERLNELLDAAQLLFFQKGYQNTPIQEIIEDVGVAKGTFYHYFKSKEDLLSQLVDRLSRSIWSGVHEVIARNDLNAVDKLNSFFTVNRTIKLENSKLTKFLMTTLYTKENILFRHNLASQNIKKATPVLAEILQQGVDEGFFAIKNPPIIAEMILNLFNSFSEIMVNLLQSLKNDTHARDTIDQLYTAYKESIERILGSEEGIIDLITENDKNKFISLMTE